MIRSRLRVFAWLVAGSALLAPVLSAQERPRRWERPGFDFSSNGVWRNRARQVAQNRAAALARGDMAQLNAALAAPGSGSSALAISGVIRVPIFLVTPSNRPIPFPRQDYDDVLLAAVPPAGRAFTVRTFYEEMSNGLFSVQGQVFDWKTLANVDTFYEGNCNGLCGAGRVQGLMQEAISAQEGLVDFGLFDNDGADGVPNTQDDDGEVDVAVFVHSEAGGECGTPNIWAHRFVYSGWGGGAYVTTSPRRDNNGQPIPGQFITINNYTIQSGLGGSTSCNAAGIMPVGTIAHETGHGLGLPDFYDTNPNDADDSEGIGEWGLMGSGNYSVPFSPSHMEGFSRMQLGWVTVRELVAGGNYELGPYTVGDTIFRITPTVPNPRGEYFLLENRQPTLGDSALVLRKASGLLIWHVDPLRYQQAFSSNQVNSGAIHGLALEEADGLANLRSSTPGVRNRGDAGDPWPGPAGQSVFSYSSNPSARLNNAGEFGGFAVDSIRRAGMSVLFRLRFGGLSTVRSVEPLAVIRVRGAAHNSFSDVYVDGDTVTISADSSQLSADGLRKFIFSAWSDGSARQHIATMTLAGTTTSATFDRQFRVRAAGIGGGSVTSTTLAADSFMVEGDSVELTAVPDAGKAFVGWIGDTVASTPTIFVRGTRPWSVSAGFINALVVADSVLRQPVLGATYQDTIRMTGGLGTYQYSVILGQLPAGLLLVPSSGVIAGIPTRDSTWTFTVRVASGGVVMELPMQLTVTAPQLSAQNVVDRLLLGGSQLTSDEIRYLDLIGNNNNLLDLGDVVAWLDRTGTVLPAPLAQRLFGGAR